MRRAGERWQGRSRPPVRARAASQSGVTLIEVLIAMALLASLFMAIVAGMLTTAQASSTATRATTADAALSGVIERIKSMDYVPCDGHGRPSPSELTTKYHGWANKYLPPGVDMTVVSVTFWNGSGFAATCSVDRGAQLLRVEVTAPGSGAPAKGELIIRDPAARPPS